MAVESGPNISNDGLLFYYDMDNTKKSWKGVNVIENTDLDKNWLKSYCGDILWNDYPPPTGIDSQVVSFIDVDSNGDGYWFNYSDDAPQFPNTTYCISVWARTVGINWNVHSYTADNSETGRIWTGFLTVPGDGQWIRLEFPPILNPSNSQSDSVSFYFNGMVAGQRYWLCAPQMTPTNSHLPYLGQGGGLCDLLGNTITPVNPVYNSDNTFSFDGSGYFTIPMDNLRPTHQITQECWFKSDTDVGQVFIGAQYGTGTNNSYALWYTASTFLGGVNIAGSFNYQSYSSALATGKWYHFVHTYDGNIQKMFIDGVQVHSWASTGKITYDTNNTKLAIGSDFNSGYDGGTGLIVKGDMPIVKIYDRALTAVEVKHSFNANRSRYGI